VGAVPVKQRADVLFANPPFVPVPECVNAAVHSNGGPDGNAATLELLGRLDEFLEDDGQAFVSLLAIERDGVPLLAEQMAPYIGTRSAEFTRMHQTPGNLRDLANAYRAHYPQHADSIDPWAAQLGADTGETTANSYVLHVGPSGAGSAGVTYRTYDGTKYPPGVFAPGMDDLGKRIGEVSVE
jgi:hypothetical protein